MVTVETREGRGGGDVRGGETPKGCVRFRFEQVGGELHHVKRRRPEEEETFDGESQNSHFGHTQDRDKHASGSTGNLTRAPEGRWG